jgi:L-lactate utilization protein LutC
MNYKLLPSMEVIEGTMKELKSRSVIPYFVENRKKALEKLCELIPSGARVMTGSSTTLEQIGFVGLLKSGKHSWNNLKDEMLSEKDANKQAELRKQSVLSEYFIGSVHALTESGETLTASASGSQLPSYVYTSNNVIWVVGAQKIVPDLLEAIKRIKEYVFPLEDKRMKDLGSAGSVIGWMLYFGQKILPNRKINLILINEALGF